MGYFRHDAIVVQGEDQFGIEIAHDHAINVFAETHVKVTEVTPAVINASRAFLIAPDGSKEGWKDSDDGDKAREVYLEFLELDDRVRLLDWVRVNFGGDEKERLYAAGPGDKEMRKCADRKEEEED